MTLILLHGDKQTESREKLLVFKQRAKEAGKEIVELSGEKHDITDIIQALESPSLFGDTRLVVLQNLYTSRRKNKEILDYLKLHELSTDLVIWESKKVDGRRLKWIKKKNGRVEDYLYPKIMFKFLESIGSPVKEKTLHLFHETLKSEPVELVYYMIIRQFRLLILVKSSSTDAKIKETKRLQKWQISRLKKQSASISLSNLLKLYRRLLHVDYQQKTGRAALDLSKTLDIFLTQV